MFILESAVFPWTAGTGATEPGTTAGPGEPERTATGHRLDGGERDARGSALFAATRIKGAH